jgi:hypothetical protein
MLEEQRVNAVKVSYTQPCYHALGCKYVMNQLITTLISLEDKPAVQDYLNFSIGQTTRIG